MKTYDSGASLDEKILEGVNILADNVASTLGPKGRNVILQEKGKRPIITKDGVSVAEFVDLEDPVMNAGAHIIKQAARETNNVAGDGTTTATVLAQAIIREGMKSEEVTKKYLEAFRNRDISSLGSFFSESVKLTDWDQSVSGKDSVIKANNDIFLEFEEIGLEITNIIPQEFQAAVEFDLILRKSSETVFLKVTDFIEFDNDFQISSVRAYRGN